MNIALLEQYAETLVRTPADVAKLRQLILSLAVQGKLVVGEVVQQRIALRQNIELISGQHLLSDEQNNRGQGIAYLTGPSDFGMLFPTVTRWTETPKSIAVEGDVLLSVKGSIGKVNIVNVKAAIGRQIMALRPKMQLMNTYLYLVLKNAEDYFQKLSKGIAIPGISREDVLNMQFLLPSLAEQERIVARVDELMGWCDTLEAQLRQRAELRQRVVQAALAEVQRAPSMQALAALLDPRIGASAAELRQMILSLAVQGKLVGLHQTNFVELGKHVELINGDRSSNYPSKDKRVPSGIPFVNAGHLVNGEIDYDDMDFITPEHYALLNSGKFQIGDILYCLRGSLGKTAVVSTDIVGAIASSLVIIRSKPSVNVRYLYYYLTSPYGSAAIKKYDNGSAQPNLSAGNVRKYMLPLPPLAEQERIVARVDELMALVDRLEALQERADAVGEQVLAGVVG